MADKPLLSVVIPTRNRQTYAECAARQVIAVTSQRVEVVLQDNSDTPDLAARVRDLAGGTSSRLSYNFTKDEVSFAKNFDLGVARSCGRYICTIGDDDAILPGLEWATDWADRNAVSAISPSLSAVYYWPRSLAGSRSHLNASVVAQPVSKVARVVDARAAVRSLLAMGGVDYLSLPLAKSYHGVVRRDLFEKIRGQTGHYFSGLSPDIYSSVSLSLLADTVVTTGWPLTLPGVCPASGSADSAAGRHTGRLSEAPHFRGHSSYDWSGDVPAVYSVETIWAETALRAVRDLGVTDIPFNRAALERVVRRRHPALRASVAPPVGTDGLRGDWAIVLRRALNAANSRTRRLVRHVETIGDLPDIGAAVSALTEPSRGWGVQPEAAGALLDAARTAG